MRTGIQVTIANNGTISTNAAIPPGMAPVGIYTDAMTGTALTFYASRDGMSGVKVGDGAGGYYTKTIAASTKTYVPLSGDLFGNGIENMNVVSGSSEGAARTLTIMCSDLK